MSSNFFPFILFFLFFYLSFGQNCCERKPITRGGSHCYGEDCNAFCCNCIKCYVPPKSCCSGKEWKECSQLLEECTASCVADGPTDPVCSTCLGGKDSKCFNCFFGCGKTSFESSTVSSRKISPLKNFLSFSSIKTTGTPKIELKSLVSIPSIDKKSLAKFDKDQDGTLSFTEFTEYNAINQRIDEAYEEVEF